MNRSLLNTNIKLYILAILFFILINSKIAPHLLLNSFEASCYSSFEKIAKIIAIGIKSEDKNKQKVDMRIPKISPFKVVSIV